jgi:hypothetical protein
MRTSEAHGILANALAAPWETKKGPPAGRTPVGFSRFHHIETIVSAVPSELYPPDPAVVRALRSVDPRVVPLCIRKVYRTQGHSLIIQTYHAIGIHESEPDAPLWPWVYRCLMPSTPTSPRLMRPTRILYHLWDPGGRKALVPGPGTWLPFDWRWLNAMESVQQDITPEEARQVREEKGREAQRRKAREAALAEASYIEQSDQRVLDRNVSAFDVDDWKNVERGRLAPPRAPRPYVDLGGRKDKTA